MSLDSYLNITKKSIGLTSANKYFYSPYFDSFLILVLFFALSKLVVFISTKILLKLTKKNIQITNMLDSPQIVFGMKQISG